MEIFTDTLSLEITQSCNLECAHCMRGKSRDNKMSKEIMDLTFDEVKYVKRLFLTGGEVFTCFNEIKDLFQVIEEKKVVIDSVEITTNGTIYDSRIYDLLDAYYKDKYFINISLDDYHEASINNNSNKELMKKNILKHFDREYLPEIVELSSYLFNVGNARNLDKPKFEFTSIGYHYSKFDDIMVIGPHIFIDALGYISDGNTSYDIREEKSLGNINNSTIVNSILSGGIKLNSNSIEDAYNKLSLIEYNFSNFRGKHYDFFNHKLREVEFTKPTVVLDEVNKFIKIIDNIDFSKDSIDDIINKLDFSSYPHDISQTYHKEFIKK